MLHAEIEKMRHEAEEARKRADENAAAASQQQEAIELVRKQLEQAQQQLEQERLRSQTPPQKIPTLQFTTLSFQDRHKQLEARQEVLQLQNHSIDEIRRLLQQPRRCYDQLKLQFLHWLNGWILLGCHNIWLNLSNLA